MGKTCIVRLWAIVAVLALGAPANADRLILQNNRIVEGDVVAEDQNTVSVEVWVAGSTLTRRIRKTDIKTWNRPNRDGPAFTTIPVIGVIGTDVTADALRAGLDEARASKARFVVLAIDSPGGEVGQMNRIVDLLMGVPAETEVVAYVRRAHSAAAVIAMSCRRIYMRPEATIGATVPFRMTEDGPADVDAKFRSVIEAKMRAANRHGGHADLLVRGMSEMDLEIYLTSEDGKPVLRTSGPGKAVKARGQIVTLTAKEAVECGFAHLTTGVVDMGQQVCGGPWHEPNRRAWNVTVGAVELQRQRERAESERLHRFLARRRAIAQAGPEYNTIERRIGELAAKAAAARAALTDLAASHEREVRQIDLEYKQAVGLATHQADPNRAVARALEAANARAATARQHLQANSTRLQAEYDAAQVEVSLLRDRQRELIATIPAE